MACMDWASAPLQHQQGLILQSLPQLCKSWGAGLQLVTTLRSLGNGQSTYQAGETTGELAPGIVRQEWSHCIVNRQHG